MSKKAPDLLTLMGSPRVIILLTAAEAAEAAGYCYDHFQLLRRCGELPHPALTRRRRHFWQKRHVRGLKAKRRRRRTGRRSFRATIDEERR